MSQPYPSLPDAAQPSPAMPPSVRTAVVLWIVEVVAGVVGIATALLGHSAIIEAGIRIGLRQAGVEESELAPGALDAVRAAPALDGTLIGSIVGLVLVCALLVRLRRADNASRIVLTVIGALGVLVNCASFLVAGVLLEAGAVGIVLLLTTVVQVVAVVAAIVFMYRRDAGAFFAKR